MARRETMLDGLNVDDFVSVDANIGPCFRAPVLINVAASFDKSSNHPAFSSRVLQAHSELSMASVRDSRLGSPFDETRLLQVPPRASQERRTSGERSRKQLPTTPHDQVLSDLFEDLDNVAEPSLPTEYAPQRDTLRDPYDGTAVGVLHAPNATADTTPLWNNLARVLELQASVARAHGEMEGLGAKPKAEVKPPQQRPWLRAETARLSGLPTTTTTSPAAQSTEGMLGRELSSSGRRAASAVSDAGDDDAVGEDEGVAEARAREIEFASLAQQFNGRKDAIAGIMGQVR